jgi:flagellar basal body-associated protein FliL
MNATDQAKIEMNTTQTTNQRLVTILLILLIALVALLVIGVVVAFLMPGSMMGSGMMMGTNGQMMNNMIAVCTDMMRDLQSH